MIYLPNNNVLPILYIVKKKSIENNKKKVNTLNRIIVKVLNTNKYITFIIVNN